MDERLEQKLNQDDFFKLFLEYKSRLEGTSRENMMFLVETFRKTKQIDNNIEKLELDLNNFFEKLDTKSKYIIQKDIEKIKANFITCSEKINLFFQSYYCNYYKIIYKSN